MKIFWDSEFTGLHQNTTLISIGFVTDTDHKFYGEFTDFNQSQIDPWVESKVLSNCVNLKWNKDKQQLAITDNSKKVSKKYTEVVGDTKFVTKQLTTWFTDFKQPIQLWGDVCSYDWVLLANLWGGSKNTPKYISYAPGDISTLFYLIGLDPIHNNRESFAGISSREHKHNALWDAVVIKRNYEKLLCRITE